jgi:hypothetical protein
MPARSGVRHHKAKMTEEQIREIRQQYAAGGVSHLALAVKFDLNTHTIFDIIKRRTWRHL